MDIRCSLPLSFVLVLLLGLFNHARADEDPSAVLAAMEDTTTAADPATFTATSTTEAEVVEECDVRLNGKCYDDLEEALHAVNIGRQAGKPAKPKSTSPDDNWSKKKVVLVLRGGSYHKGSFVLRPDIDLKSFTLTTSGTGRAKIDCGDDRKPGLAFEGTINATELHGLEVVHCAPALHFTPSYKGNSIYIYRSAFLGNRPDPVYRVLSLLIDAEKEFDHPDNGLPLRYTDAEIRDVWLSEDRGLSEFPMRLAREDTTRRLDVQIYKSYFNMDPHATVPRLDQSYINWDNGADYYLNKIYKKVGVKTDKPKHKKTHMLSRRRISGEGRDSQWDLNPPFLPNEIGHNSPAFRRMLARDGIY